MADEARPDETGTRPARIMRLEKVLVVLKQTAYEQVGTPRPAPTLSQPTRPHQPLSAAAAPTAAPRSPRPRSTWRAPRQAKTSARFVGTG